MTVGEKIKKFRLLKGMTQKELGMKMGFSASTAATRILKYESDQMAPRIELRKKLADALDVDLSAISDINIESTEDVMHTFFLLEEKANMEISRSGDTICLTFDNKDGKNDLLMTYLYSWYSQKKTYFSNDDQDAGRKKYELWKSRFPKDLDLLWNDLRTKIASRYDSLISNLESTAQPAENLAEYIQHVQDVIETDCNVTFDTKLCGTGDSALTITFYTSQLIDPPTDAMDALARFFYDLRTLESYGMPLQDAFYLRPDGIQVVYILHLPLLASIADFLKERKNFRSLKESGIYSDGEIEFIQTDFNRSIQDYKNENLREYIEFQYPPEE